MATVRVNYGTVVSLTITNANLTSSSTAGWQSQSIDNSSNLYSDYLVQVKLAAVNTAPASNASIYLYGFGLIDSSGSDYSTTGSGVPSGSEGTLTFPDITTLAIVSPLLGVIPYPVQNKAIVSSAFSVANAFGGVCPAKFSIGMINFSGMTLSVTTIKVTPIYYTST